MSTYKIIYIYYKHFCKKKKNNSIDKRRRTAAGDDTLGRVQNQKTASGCELSIIHGTHGTFFYNESCINAQLNKKIEDLF